MIAPERPLNVFDREHQVQVDVPASLGLGMADRSAAPDVVGHGGGARDDVGMQPSSESRRPLHIKQG